MAVEKATKPAQNALQATNWSVELQNPDDVFGTGLDADGRRELAQKELPFCIVDAEEFFFGDGSNAVKLSLVIAPDETHDEPWETTTVVGLPKNKDEKAPLTDRERLLRYFNEMGENARPVGPLIAMLVEVNQPQPYWAIKKE